MEYSDPLAESGSPILLDGESVELTPPFTGPICHFLRAYPISMEMLRIKELRREIDEGDAEIRIAMTRLPPSFRPPDRFRPVYSPPSEK